VEDRLKKCKVQQRIARKAAVAARRETVGRRNRATTGREPSPQPLRTRSE
jgi:hypothetical protein